jgi:hypothetical protein
VSSDTRRRTADGTPSGEAIDNVEPILVELKK